MLLVFLKFSDEDGVVLAAEAEGVGHGDFDVAVSGGVGHVVEVAFFAGLIEVDGGGDVAGIDGLDSDDRLDPTRVQVLKRVNKSSFPEKA